MATTARVVYELALALIDEVDDDGTIDTEATASYAGKAPKLIDLLQRELALCEGATVTTAISALTDTLILTDDTALRVMPFGLAARFAQADKDVDMYNEHKYDYETAKRTVGVTETVISDEYSILDGMQLQGVSDTTFTT